MCNLSELIEERAIQKGLEKGIAQGMTQGIAQGIAQGMAQGMEIGISAFIKSLQKLGQDNDYILNELMENFSLSKEDALKYL